jgi:AcrR family transcriptional regulator
MTRSETRGQRDRAATEIRLVDAVGALLARDGFSALGINALAAEAGVDKVLIYRYFDGMPGLLQAFGESADFWPSVEEVLGAEPWDTLPIGERWAGGLSRYAAALRRRPITKEILAWEQVEQSELCEILRDARIRWFEELMTHFPDDPDATDVDLVATILLIVGAIHYFVVVGRLQADFSGLEVGSEAGWQQIDDLIRTICVRTLRPR